MGIKEENPEITEAEPAPAAEQATERAMEQTATEPAAAPAPEEEPKKPPKPVKVSEAEIAKCKAETYEHIALVQEFMGYCIEKLIERMIHHDASKLESPEVEGFAMHKIKLANLTYGTPEYEENREALKKTLDHHYTRNRHHPDHYPNGINGMTLLDLLEMFCDWFASTRRQHDGNLLMSIEKNAERFKIDPQLLQILRNTVEEFDKIGR